MERRLGMSLESKIALVRGVSRPLGNGRAIALTLARKGLT
jgi:NAD(P)-dependent dehydrogenase (short-subunit alcohol dehydrogenase family)